MSTYRASDGTELHYREDGRGAAVVVLAGGPLVDAAYLGDLGGLTERVRLIVPDLRGTGDSPAPADPALLRCDRLVDDVEALREHLALDRLDLLAHSAGAAVAVLYAARHPDRVGRLVLVTPSPRVVGIDPTPADRLATARLRAAEPWFPAAFAALTAIQDGTGADWDALTPFSYGRWDAGMRAFDASMDHDRAAAAVAGYYAPDAYDPAAVRSALAEHTGPVLVLGGQVDIATPPPSAAEYATVFGRGRLAIQTGAAHYPWLDDPAGFVATVAGFLADA
jgi:pimeloyl-ACP methyl ester carboxylesterase